uniref:Uncharacterized protein n=1 Tax=Aegilops tauschii subsp. strangulata TaxID=200361 RepID=A0A453N7C8_AEGTS
MSGSITGVVILSPKWRTAPSPYLSWHSWFCHQLTHLCLHPHPP